MPRSWKIPRKILCATDLTPSSDKAVDRAIQLAGEWKASLLLVHIVDDTGLLTKDFTPDPVAAADRDASCGHRKKHSIARSPSFDPPR